MTACRYCGLLTASLAAAEQARRLDPKVRTTAAHTYFMLGDYQRVIDYEIESVPFMRSLALCMLGRRDEARVVLQDIDTRIRARSRCTRSASGRSSTATRRRSRR